MAEVSIGQNVVFVRDGNEYAAIITGIHNERLANLVVFCGDNTIRETSVPFWDQKSGVYFKFVGD